MFLSKTIIVIMSCFEKSSVNIDVNGVDVGKRFPIVSSIQLIAIHENTLGEGLSVGMWL